MNQTQKEWLGRLSSTNVSDALDFYGLRGAVHGVLPTWSGCRRVSGEVVTLRLTAAGETPPKVHLGHAAIAAARAGDVIVVDNAGRPDISCWGGVLATSAKCKGVAGVLIDGFCRDIDDYVDLDFSVYARGPVVQSARGRAVEAATNEPIQFGNVLVRPGDGVVADRSGVAFIPRQHMDEVLEKAVELFRKEEAMMADLRSGMEGTDVDRKYRYNSMLSK